MEQQRYEGKFGRQSFVMPEPLTDGIKQRRNPRQIKMRITKAEHDLTRFTQLSEEFSLDSYSDKFYSTDLSTVSRDFDPQPQAPEKLYYQCQVDFLLKIKRRLVEREDRLTNLRSLILP